MPTTAKEAALHGAAVDRDVLRRMTAALAEAAQPRRIILFGSRARGEAAQNSDVDLLVVVDGPLGESRLDLVARLRRALAPFRVAKDVLVYEASEFARWRRTTNHVAARAAREGVVLYER